MVPAMFLQYCKHIIFWNRYLGKNFAHSEQIPNEEKWFPIKSKKEYRNLSALDKLRYSFGPSVEIRITPIKLQISANRHQKARFINGFRVKNER